MIQRLAGVAVLAAFTVAQVHGQVPTDGVGIVIGGFGGGVSVEVIDAFSTCFNLPSPPTGAIEGWNAEYVDDKIFLCGGSDGNYQAECFALDMNTKTWTTAGKLDDGRENAASTVLNGEMVILGGYSDRVGWLNGVEKKTKGTLDQWTKMTNWTLPAPMFEFAAAAMDDTRIIIAGGNEYDVPFRDNVVILDTTTGVWTETTPMPVGLASLAGMTAMYNGETGLMISGGATDDYLDKLSDVWFLSYTTMQWTQLPSLPHPRNYHCMTYIDGYPAVIGGYDEATLNEILLFKDNAWVEHPDILGFARSDFGCPTYTPKSIISC